MSLSLRRRVVKWSFGTILVLSASVVSAQRPLNMNDYDLRNQYGTMPGLNDRNPNQIQYGNIGGVVDNNAPQEADTTQKPPKIRKPLESYFFDDSTRARSIFVWHPDLKYKASHGGSISNGTTSRSSRSTRRSTVSRTIIRFCRTTWARPCWAIWAALRFRSISF